MMFRCERCGSSFSPIRVSSRQNCPRCRARDGVSVPLVLEMNPFGGFKAAGADTDSETQERKG
jgi:hypothetical protein